MIGFAKTAGLQRPVVIPFRGGGDVAINLVGGNIDAALGNFSEVEGQIRAGDIRPLAVFARERLKSLPDVPTGAEIGVSATYSTTRGFGVLKGAPAERIAALESALVKAMNAEAFRDYLESSGQSPQSVTGAKEWQAQIDEYARTGKEALAGIAR